MYSIEFLSDNASRGGNEGGAKVSENPAMPCAHGGWGPTDSQIQEQAAHHQKSDVSATPHFVGRVDGGRILASWGDSEINGIRPPGCARSSLMIDMASAFGYFCISEKSS